MEIAGILLVALVPALVSAIVGVLKKLPTFADLTGEARAPFIRVTAFGISLLITVAGSWVSGTMNESVLNESVQSFVGAVILWLSAEGTYNLAKK